MNEITSNNSNNLPLPSPPPSSNLLPLNTLNSLTSLPSNLILTSSSSFSPSFKSFIPLSIIKLLEKITESLPVTILMSLFTIWALFSDDIRLSSTDKSADNIFMIIITIAFFLFSLELIAACIYKEGYLNIPNFEQFKNQNYIKNFQNILQIGSFYFWLDIVATISLIFEIHWIIGDSIDTSNQSSLKSARAGRASRAGARAGRIIRLVRMVKLYKYYTETAEEEPDIKKNKIEGNQNNQSIDHLPLVVSSISDPNNPIDYPHPLQGIRESDYENEKIASQFSQSSLSKLNVESEKNLTEKKSKFKLIDDEESKVGAAMTDITTKRVIVLVLVMLICIPLMSYSAEDVSPSFGTHVFHEIVKSSVINSNGTNQNAIDLSVQFLRQDFSNIVFLKSNEQYYINDQNKLDKLRSSELAVYDFTSHISSSSGTLTKLNTIGKFSIKHTTVNEAIYGIYLTIFILALLVVGTYYFSADVNTLVIIPIEKMVKLVQEISKNPLGVEYTMLGEEDGFLEGMETTLLLQTINKIGGLMKVGFGEAGASVIAKNLSNSTENKLNLMGSGNLIQSIFGFCDVRNFTDTTECLQEEVMLFVNRIAHILHSIVVQCSGSANKNIGDAFLLTWKIDDGFSQREISYLADQALLAFLKSIIELTRYQDFICNFSILSTNRLFKRFPGYKVRIGSGLHYGWAVEGAIGSNLKIDVTYLSPHVGMSEFLESSTKTYGVALLMSEAFYKLLTSTAAKYCRQIDRVKTSEHEEPFGLFTYDCDLNYEFHPEEEFMNKFQKKKRRLIDTRKSGQISGSTTLPRNAAISGSGQISGSIHSIKTPKELPAVTQLSRSASKLNITESNSDSHPSQLSSSNHSNSKPKKEEEYKPKIEIPKYLESIWDSDMDLTRLRHLVNENFRKLWKEGMVAYIKGDWQKALSIFKETLRSSEGEDGPSKYLVSYIEENGGIPPRDWEGYHS